MSLPWSPAAFQCFPVSPGFEKVNLLLKGPLALGQRSLPKIQTLSLCSYAALVQVAGWSTHGVTPLHWQHGFCALNTKVSCWKALRSLCCNSSDQRAPALCGHHAVTEPLPCPRSALTPVPRAGGPLGCSYSRALPKEAQTTENR